jgi:hypothetical protein
MKLSEKNSILKNLIALNLSFFFVFSALNNIINIQSVLNKEDDLGTIGSLTLFITQFLTCIVIPQVLIEKFGFKKTLAFAQMCDAIYIASNFYPKLYTIIISKKFIEVIFIYFLTNFPQLVY